MSKKSERKKGLVDKLEEIPDLDIDPTTGAKMFHVREIDYLAYNTLFSIQQLLETIREFKQEQREIRRIVSRIEARLPSWSKANGDEGDKEEGEDEGHSGQDNPDIKGTDV